MDGKPADTFFLMPTKLVVNADEIYTDINWL